MKSVTVKTDNGQLLVKVKQAKTGVIVDSLEDIAPLVITCVMDDNKRITVRTERMYITKALRGKMPISTTR